MHTGGIMAFWGYPFGSITHMEHIGIAGLGCITIATTIKESIVLDHEVLKQVTRT
jgi:hypothetical protein